MKTLALLIALLVSGVVTARPGCKCRPVPRGASSPGANELIERGEQTVGQVRGRVVFGYDGKPVGGAIVELFRLRKEDSELESYQIAGYRKRDRACLAGPDGGFCFPDLPPGRYILRAGSQEHGFNHIHMKLNVGPGRAKSSGEDLLLELTAGT